MALKVNFWNFKCSQAISFRIKFIPLEWNGMERNGDKRENRANKLNRKLFRMLDDMLV